MPQEVCDMPQECRDMLQEVYCDVPQEGKLLPFWGYFWSLLGDLIAFMRGCCEDMSGHAFWGIWCTFWSLFKTDFLAFGVESDPTISFFDSLS